MYIKTVLVPSVQNIDFSDMVLPGIVVYDHPEDFPDSYIARVWEFKTNRPTNVAISNTDLNAIRDQARLAGFTPFPRHPEDDPCIMEVWLL